MLRSLTHYWRINLAVLAAVAVAAAVLTGALLVGDSVRGSLRDLTLDRLGGIDVVLAAERFFRAEIADDLLADEELAAGFDRVVPAILLRGNVTKATSRARASQVSVLGVDERFVELYAQPQTSPAFRPGNAATTLDWSRRDGQVFPSVVINRSLAVELAAEPGDQVLVRFRLGNEIPRDTVLGNRDTSELVGVIRGEVRQIIPDLGFGRFDLSPHQTLPLNAYVDLGQLQAALEQAARVNALLLRRRAGADVEPQAAMRRVLRLGDLGLQESIVSVGGGEDSLRAVTEMRSDEFVVRRAAVEAIEATAADAGVGTLGLQAYLANELRLGDRTTPYSMVLGIDNPSQPAPFGQLLLSDGSPAPVLSDDQVLLNAWTAEDLRARAGDRLEIAYYVVGLDEALRTESTAFEVAGVVQMAGLAVDPKLTPEYPGIEGVDDIASWEPPFPVDLTAIRPKDEAYWDEHRGAPKAFVSAATARRLWSTRYGALTSIRIEDGQRDSEGLWFGHRLLPRIDPIEYGFRFLDVKSAGLEASSGATNFGGLFIGFSMFIIASAVMIINLLFRLGIQQRARQAGLMLALGYGVKRVRRGFLAEGMVLTLVGSVIGLAGGVAYARLMILGLTTSWLPAVGSPLLFLYVHPTTLALGCAISILVAALTVWRTTRTVTHVPAARLLAGAFAIPGASGHASVGRRRTIAGSAGALGVGLLAYALMVGAGSSPGLALAIGGCLLISGLAGFSAWCRSGRGRLARGGGAAAIAMAARNSGWNPGRSILSVGLVASAAFVIVTVAANTRDPESEEQVVESGAGGYALMAVADVPLHHRLDTADGRFDLGFSVAAEARLQNVAIEHLRLLPGDDASCLNLYRPQRPRVLGLPASMLARGGFHFTASLAAEHGVSDNPWKLLEIDLGPGVVPAIADANSAQWIMHVGLGDDVLMEDELGEPVRFRLVGTVGESIFQSELLISEAAFLRHFPGQSGFAYFLIDAPIESTAEVATALESTLADFGFDTTPTAAKIAAYLVVVNTYLSTFQMLGGLGLLLGTVGLGIVLLRNVIERRGELATLRAFGFPRRFLARMVLAENAFLLTTGVAIGTGSALLAVAPRFLLAELLIPWRILIPTLMTVLGVGMAASLAAMRGALRIPLLPALKADS